MSADVEPGWLTYEGAAAYCGLSKRKLEEEVQKNSFKHRFRGRRLINRESLDEWIEGGMDLRPASVKANQTRAKNKAKALKEEGAK